MVCLDNSDRDVDRKALLEPTNETVELAREVHKDYGNFGILLDEGHFPLMKEDSEKFLEMAKGLLTHIHMGNCYSKNSSKSHFGDKHFAFGIPDSDVGLEELKVFLGNLKEIGFFGKKCAMKLPVISFEVNLGKNR